MDRNVTGLDVAFETVEYRQAGLIGQSNIQNDRARLEFPSKRQSFLGPSCHQTAKSHFSRKVTHNSGEAVIVFNDEQKTLGIAQCIAIVVDLSREGRSCH